MLIGCDNSHEGPLGWGLTTTRTTVVMIVAWSNVLYAHGRAAWSRSRSVRWMNFVIGSGSAEERAIFGG